MAYVPTPFYFRIGPTRRDNEERHSYYTCPVYIGRDLRKNGAFITDARGYTPADTAAKAAMLGTVITQYLNNHTGAGGRTFYDASAFAKLFDLPTGQATGDLSTVPVVPVPPLDIRSIVPVPAKATADDKGRA